MMARCILVLHDIRVYLLRPRLQTNASLLIRYDHCAVFSQMVFALQFFSFFLSTHHVFAWCGYSLLLSSYCRKQHLNISTSLGRNNMENFDILKELGLTDGEIKVYFAIDRKSVV